MDEVIQIYLGPNKIKGKEAGRTLTKELSEVVSQFKGIEVRIANGRMDAHYFVYSISDKTMADQMVDRINALNGYCAKRK